MLWVSHSHQAGMVSMPCPYFHSDDPFISLFIVPEVVCLLSFFFSHKFMSFLCIAFGIKPSMCILLVRELFFF